MTNETRPANQMRRRLLGSAGLIFLQMLPATLVAPAIRPLFAAHHGGAEGPMHAFMSVNMIGAIVGAFVVTSIVRRPRSVLLAVALLSLIDGALLFVTSLPLSVGVVLAARAVEGAAHVGTATLLLAQVSAQSAPETQSRAMGMAGGAIMLAIATGSAAGGGLLFLGPRAPFLAGAGLTAVVAAIALSLVAMGKRTFAPEQRRLGRMPRTLWPAISLAFVARFTVGLLVVTFALFAHEQHDTSDMAVGAYFALLTYPFALATYPAARLRERVTRGWLFIGGVVAYAACLAALGFVPAWLLGPTMFLAGLASAVIFASVLVDAGTLGGTNGKASAMAWVNAAGAAGMLCGPATAGIVSALLRPHYGTGFAHRTIFLVAAGALMTWLVLAIRALLAPSGAQGSDLRAEPG